MSQIIYVLYNMIIMFYGLRTSLAKEIEEQMLIVTQLPDVSAQSRAITNGTSNIYIAW